MDRYGRAAIAALLTVLAACATEAPSQRQPEASRGGASPSGPSMPALATDIDRIRNHLAAFQAIADEHGGVRVVGSAGFEASVEYALAVPAIFLLLTRLGAHPVFDRGWTVLSLLLMGLLATIYSFDFWVA